MQLRVLRKTGYKGYKIYIMNFGSMFQYLFADRDGEIYQNHMFMEQGFLNKLKFKLRLLPVPYTKKEMEDAEDVILDGAIRSIDALEEMKEKEKKHENKQEKKETGVPSSLAFMQK